MPKDFFNEPFDEGTITKLHLFKNYLKEWLPVFVKMANPKTINIFDFFAGAGADSNMEKGSPLLAIDSIPYHEADIKALGLSINVYLNEFKKKNFKALQEHLNNNDFPNDIANIHLESKDFFEAFDSWFPKMKYAANLVWLDQFGVKFVNTEVFHKLVNQPMTDLLFFISSTIFKRLPEQDGIHEILKTTKEEVKDLPLHHVHRFVADKFKAMIPVGKTYYLASFSIRKQKSGLIYGVIFGSSHVLGLEKFLKVCWDENNLTGEANFDIDDDKINPAAPFMFAEMNKSKKMDMFEKELLDEIKKGNLKDEWQIYIYAITNGFLGKHVTPVIKKLIADKKIEKDNFGFTYDTLKTRNKIYKLIRLRK